MADNIQLPSSTTNVATDEIAGVHYPRTKITLGSDGINGGDVSSSNPLPVSVSNPVTSFTVTNFPSIQTVAGQIEITNLPLTQQVNVTNFPATQVVSGTVSISNPVTSVTVSNLPATQAVSGTVNIGTLPSVTISNPVTSVSVSNFPATQAVSATSLPLPSGASTEATLAQLKTVTDTMLTAIQAMQTAIESLNTKTTSVNTGSVAGTVAVSNFTDNGLTNSQLRASAVSTTDATSQEILDEMRSISENLLYFTQATVGNMAKTDSSKRLEVSMQTTNAGYSNIHLNAIGSTSGASISLLGMPYYLSNSATTSIYDQITFS